MTKDEALAFLSRALAPEIEERGEDHPTAEELVAYRAGTLTAEEMEAIRDHLTFCRECVTILLDLAGSRDAANSERAAVWRSLEPRLGGSAKGRARRWAFSLSRVAAVVLLATTLGLGALSGLLWRDNARLRESLAEPQLFVPRADLYPAGFLRDEGGVNRLEVPAGTDLFALTFQVANHEPYPGYELQVVDAHGDIVWSGRGLRRAAGGNFEIAVRRGFLAAGRYRFQIHGRRAESRELVTEYEVQLAYE